MSPFNLGNSDSHPVLWQDIHHRDTPETKLLKNTWMLLFLAQHHLQAKPSAVLTVYCLGPGKILLHIIFSESFIQSHAWGLVGCWQRRQTLTDSEYWGREGNVLKPLGKQKRQRNLPSPSLRERDANKFLPSKIFLNVLICNMERGIHEGVYLQ